MMSTNRFIQELSSEHPGIREHAAWMLGNIINGSQIEQLDKLKAKIIKAVDSADTAPTYKEMKQAAAPLLVAIYTRRNQLLTVEINLDSDRVLRRPRPPRGSRGVYRMPAFAMVK